MKMQSGKALLGVLAVASVFAAQAVAVSVDIETYKDNTVSRDNVTEVIDYKLLSGTIYNLDCFNGALTYTAFDMSALPAGAVITSAQVGVYELRTSRNYHVFTSLVDVADDWNETTLDWTTAAASYGATTGFEQNGGTQALNAAMVDFSLVKWQGVLSMINTTPTMVWSVNRTALYEGTDTYHGGVAWTDADLLNNLNLILQGDQTAVFTYTSAYGTNEYFGERQDSTNPGATLRLEYDVIQPGDANNDGMVNLADLQILGDNWQASGVSWSSADFTFDGTVNLADLQIVGDNWGYGTATDLSFDQALALVSIPEPASLSLLALALPLALRRRVDR